MSRPERPEVRRLRRRVERLDTPEPDGQGVKSLFEEIKKEAARPESDIFRDRRVLDRIADRALRSWRRERPEELMRELADALMLDPEAERVVARILAGLAA